MRVITDWHIHSKYSRACSKDLTLPNIAAWCARKGIQVAATGDWTHPRWVEHLREQLMESEPGLYRLKDGSSPTRFMLVTELSQIYKRGGKTRRVHNLVFAPSLETVERVNTELKRREFNLASDGRPILGIDSEELYKLLVEIDPRVILIPAHAWTPWYSVFGSKSGFDSIEECFGEMASRIYAIETGLSSDPLMNARVPLLEQVMLISNSDAHSCANLGREANVFDLPELSCDAFVTALKTKNRSAFLRTIEFFPEEGKYHLDGCANCTFSCEPAQSKRLGGCCPVCKRPLTIGVLNRVDVLAVGREAVSAPPFCSIVPLAQILAEVFGVSSVHSKRVQEAYLRLTDRIADEFTLLLETPLEQMRSESGVPQLAEAIERVRAGRVSVAGGYDGIYGTVKIFSDAERATKQSTLL